MARSKRITLLMEGYPSVKNIIAFLSSLCVVLCLTGCNQKLSQQDYIEWVTNYDNGLHVQKTINDLVFDLQYKPDDLVNLERKQSASQDSLKYFTLKIGTATQQDLLQYRATGEAAVQQNIYYYSYLFQNNIYIDYNGTKFPCALYHFERSPDSKGMYTFNLGFELPVIEDDTNVYVEIAPERLYSLPIRFQVSLNKVPKLQI